MLKHLNGNENIRFIASDETWIEESAIHQLERTSKLPNMRFVIGMPDLHPGKGNPIGAAFVSQKTFYPYLVGGDIGCGISLWQTSLITKKIKLDKWCNKLLALEEKTETFINEELENAEILPTAFDGSLGTIGGGNHFAELQVIEEIKNESLFSSLNLDKSKVMLLVHSGSRGLGKFILEKHITKFGVAGIEDESEDAKIYMEEHNNATKWAKLNRATIAKRFSTSLGAECKLILDLCHNSLTEAIIDGCQCWLHRKGAAPSDSGPLVIPGSRGSFSYLANPIGDKQLSAYSLAHGAGRKWSRSESKHKLSKNYSAESFKRTKFGSYVICENKDLLYEEAPQAYKDIETVINDLVNVGLIEIIAVLKPIITYKVGT
ncbi:MAG: RNA ligase RtcB family protein [Candidatus Caenarcaniphilales bacterium]|nr:RNA ligase RtcB family protein [Candidatus Caenarcaniphilales bacterium]